jgi:hypothetical protein
MRVELLVILVLAVSATGCGEESPNPEEVVSAAVTGLSKGDEKKVCAQLTEPARRKLLDVLADDPPIVKPITASTCEEAITKVHAQLTEPIRAVLEDGEVDEAKITGNKAVVHVTGAGTDVELQKVSDEWKITGGLFNR